MAMFVCLKKDKWVMGRCNTCHDDCGVGHPLTQQHGTRLWGEGFGQKKPATGKGLVAEGRDPE